jgi:uncharacterized membrane protein
MAYIETEAQGDVLGAGAGQAGNISDMERWGSMAAGIALAAYGVSRRSAGGWLMAGGGALLIRRGLRGIGTAAGAGDSRQALSGPRGVLVEESVTINRPVEELYRFWRNLENLPRFMRHLQSVERVTDTLSRWRASGPAGADVEWNAEIINEVPNRVIAWRSLEGSDVVSAGSVNFEGGGAGRGTRVRVRLQYSPPGGKVGATIARLMGRDAASEIRDDLQQLKQLLEGGH